ncbi:MAG: class I adenylate-forming enzyme family protein [Saprospiraceae bacterium]
MVYRNLICDAVFNLPKHSIILNQDNKTLTVEKLQNDSLNLALYLSKKGVMKGDRVIILIRSGSEFLTILFANLLLGCLIALIDPEMGKENFISKLKQFNPTYTFIDSRLYFLNEHPILKFLMLNILKRVPNILTHATSQIFTIGPRLPILKLHHHLSLKIDLEIPDYNRLSNSDPDIECMVVYTSGTLDKPKGVMHSYNSLNASINLLKDQLLINRDQSLCTHLPHFMLIGIIAGVHVHIWNYNMLPQKKLEFISFHSITTLFGPPSDFLPLLEYCSKVNRIFPSCLKNIYLGSAPIYKSFLSRIMPYLRNCEVHCLYGMTEHLFISIISGKDKLLSTTSIDIVGKPFANVEVRILENDEISILSPQLFKRYLHEDSRHGYFNTGDLGRLDENEQLSLFGRRKNMIIRSNFNIYPGLYEPTINSIPNVKNAVMLGIYNEAKSDEMVYLVIESDKQLSKSNIFNALTQGPFSIDKQAIPDEILFMKIPLFGRQNKVNKKVLIQHIQEIEK